MKFNKVNKRNIALTLIVPTLFMLASCSSKVLDEAKGQRLVDKFTSSYSGTARQAKPMNLKAGIQGFYFYARSGSAGYRHHVFWKQNGLFFEVESRALSKQQVINMAISMAKELPIKSAR